MDVLEKVASGADGVPKFSDRFADERKVFEKMLSDAEKEAAEKAAKKAAQQGVNDGSKILDSMKLKAKIPESAEVGSGAAESAVGNFQNLENLSKIKEHLTVDVDGMSFEPNKAMLSRIEEMLKSGSTLEGAYKDFYEHELTEQMLMKNGLDYEAAHNKALEIHNVCPQQLYHPDIVKEYQEWFNKLDFEYWDIDF